MPDFEAQVTFMLKADTEEALMAKARQVDDEINERPEEELAEADYTVAQAFQIVWHQEPQWLHDNVLFGWTLDKVCDDNEHGWHDVWPAP